MLRHGRFALIATGCAAAIAAMLLIPGREQSAVADTAAPVVTDFTSQETIAAIDALLGPSEEAAPQQVATAEPPSGINPVRTATDPNLQTAALTTPAAPTTDLEGAPLVDPNLRPDSIGPSAVNLRAGPSTATATVGVLQPGQAVQTGQSDGGWIEVTLPDGTTGWVFSRYLASAAAAVPSPSEDSADKPSVKAKAMAKATIKGKGNGDLEGRTARIDSALTARAKPNSGAPMLFQTEPGERVRILDVRGDWLRIRTADGSSGWIRAG
jgi:SH3-like domain-containing protein